MGLDSSQPSVDAPLGSTPFSDNYVMRDGALEPRAMLTPRPTTPQPFGADVTTGMYELVSTVNARTPIASGTTRWAVYGQAATPNGWSILSYVSAFGLNDPPNLAAGTDYVDFTQIYDALSDQMLAVGAVGSQQTMYCARSGATVMSSLTGAPRAKYVTTLDNYVVAFNTKDGNGTYVQRVIWNDRGSASSWTGGLSGFEDLLAMAGAGTGVVVQDNKLLLFSDQEVWQGVQRDWPFTWSFQPYDTSVGCPYPRTLKDTPLGHIFLGKDYQTYLMPKGGGPATPIGDKIHKSVRDNIDQPSRAWAVYDHTYSQYQLFYPVQSGSGYPQRALYLDIASGSWAPQSFDRIGGALSLSAGAEIFVSSSATTWGGLLAAGIRWADLTQSWAQLGGSSEKRAVLVGSSRGTAYVMDSTVTSDNGTAVLCRWQSSGLAGMDPSEQKTITEFRADYQGDSSSSLTVRFSPTVGASFQQDQQMNLPAVSSISQGIAYPYMGARYPSFEVQSQGQRHRLFRFWVQFKRGGR